MGVFGLWYGFVRWRFQRRLGDCRLCIQRFIRSSPCTVQLQSIKSDSCLSNGLGCMVIECLLESERLKVLSDLNIQPPVSIVSYATTMNCCKLLCFGEFQIYNISIHVEDYLNYKVTQLSDRSCYSAKIYQLESVELIQRTPTSFSIKRNKISFLSVFMACTSSFVAQRLRSNYSGHCANVNGTMGEFYRSVGR